MSENHEASDPTTTPGEQRPQFGNRLLRADDDVFTHNAWDHVEWDDAQEAAACAAVTTNGVVRFTPAELADFDTHADRYWDAFYGVHTNRFFKDRHWLFTEFGELKDAANRVVFEVGCGVGNTIFPLLAHRREEVHVHCCDFSATAIDILKQHPDYDPARCNAFVLDASAEGWQAPRLAEGSVDIAIMVFVLSAIHPERFATVARELLRFVKPGGLLLFRDYGRYDLAQLRFKPGRSLGENFYARGDGTRVYFFTQEEVRSVFEDAGWVQTESLVDRRLQVNRSRMLKMYRVWIQAKFRKP